MKNQKKGRLGGGGTWSVRKSPKKKRRGETHAGNWVPGASNCGKKGTGMVLPGKKVIPLFLNRSSLLSTKVCNKGSVVSPKNRKRTESHSEKGFFLGGGGGRSEPDLEGDN